MRAIPWTELAPRVRASAVALGNFDGVHVGHQAILTRLRESARRWDLEPLAVSFHPHPRNFFHPAESASLLTPLEEKAALLRDQGVTLLPLAFDASLAALEADDFAEEVLVRRLRAAAVCLGPDHRFGRGARGDAILLARHFEEADRVAVVPPVSIDGVKASSSAARQALDAGDLPRLATFLGRPYAMRGKVVRGRGRGAGLGFPTANLSLDEADKAWPAPGVYGGAAALEDGTAAERLLPAVMNIGTAPTLRGGEAWIEAHLPGFSGDLYGKALTLFPGLRLREERKFPDLEALKTQIARDLASWNDSEKGFAAWLAKRSGSQAR